MATQAGTSIIIGFGSFAYTGFVIQDGSTESVGETEIVKDAAGDTHTVITSDPGHTHSFTCAILTTGGSITPPAIDATITLIPPQGTSQTYRCTSASVKHAVGANMLDISMIQEDSMTYS